MHLHYIHSDLKKLRISEESIERLKKETKRRRERNKEKEGEREGVRNKLKSWLQV